MYTLYVQVLFVAIAIKIECQIDNFRNVFFKYVWNVKSGLIFFFDKSVLKHISHWFILKFLKTEIAGVFSMLKNARW